MPVFAVICDVIGIFSAPKGRDGHDEDDAVRIAGACVSSMAGEGALAVSCAVTVCNAVGGLLTNASEGGARDIDADEDRSGDVGRAMVWVERLREVGMVLLALQGYSSVR